ncbi:MAG: PilZ domain-containing protein [Phycisphaerae bacterium]|nr:PilZ domain-containing protein [Phycisphaerae bacterium]MBN8598809.1 PilZ domain-containing protein [Planctomycetota bacterium]
MPTDRPSNSESNLKPDTSASDSIGRIEPKSIDAPQGADRRRHTRMYVRKPCKVFHFESRQYIPACTHDFSVGGAMVWIEAGRQLNVGDNISVIVGWDSGAVVRQDSSIPARVLRVVTMEGGRQAAAVQFKAVQQARLAA